MALGQVCGNEGAVTVAVPQSSDTYDGQKNSDGRHHAYPGSQRVQHSGQPLHQQSLDWSEDEETDSGG